MQSVEAVEPRSHGVTELRDSIECDGFGCGGDRNGMANLILREVEVMELGKGNW